jgi:hypothetical protein
MEARDMHSRAPIARAGYTQLYKLDKMRIDRDIPVLPDVDKRGIYVYYRDSDPHGDACKNAVGSGKGYVNISFQAFKAAAKAIYEGSFITMQDPNSHQITNTIPYDVLAARISKCIAFAGRTKCAGATA